jgi:hypothetical protein
MIVSFRSPGGFAGCRAAKPVDPRLDIGRHQPRCGGPEHADAAGMGQQEKAGGMGEAVDHQ